MRSRWFLFLILWPAISWAQVDSTINLKRVEVEEILPENNYNREEIDSFALLINQSSSLDELLAKHSNTFIRNYGPGALSTAAFRGMGSHHTRVYWNGIALNSSMNGTVDLSLFDRLSSDNASLRAGAGSMIEGSGSLGGAVDLRQNDQFNRGLNASVLQSFASYSNYKTAGAVGWGNQKWFVRGGGSYNRAANNFEYVNPEIPGNPKEKMEGANSDGFNAFLNAGTFLNSKNKLSFRGIMVQANRNLPKLNLQPLVHERQFDAQNLAMLNWNFYGKVQNELKAGMRSSVLEYENRNIDLNSLSRETNVFIQERLNYRIGQKIEMRSSILFDHFETYNEKYGKTQARQEIQIIHELNAYLSRRITLRALLKTHLTNQNSLPFLPSVSAGFLAIKNWLRVTINASYHGAIPSMNDLYWGEGGNPDLKPESGFSGELNLTGEKRVKIHGFDYRISNYYNQIDNWLQWTPDDNGIWRVSNLDRVRAYGSEIHLGYGMYFKKYTFRISMDYNWNNSLNSSDQRLIYVPEHRNNINFSASYKKLTLYYRHQYVGERFVLPDNSSWLPEYLVADVGFALKIPVRKTHIVIVDARLNNFMNVNYQSIAHRPMPGRNFVVSLNYQFR